MGGLCYKNTLGQRGNLDKFTKWIPCSQEGHAAYCTGHSGLDVGRMVWPKKFLCGFDQFLIIRG